ncbi:MAG: SprT-like domain-containing protein [Candidatus Tyrphobacter sp.]
MLPSEAELQLLFAHLNNRYFEGAAPDCAIAYNERFSNSAGRITYGRKPLLVELSPKHFRRHPEALEETLLHEMVHAWCYDRFRDTGHGVRFRKKMRECGLNSIHHDLGRVRPKRESAKRYIMRCEACAFETLRRRVPARPASCPRCNPRGYDARFPLSVHEIVETRPLGIAAGEAAQKSERARLREPQ